MTKLIHVIVYLFVVAFVGLGAFALRDWCGQAGGVPITTTNK